MADWGLPPPPNYIVPNATLFGQMIGNLPSVYRQAQREQNALDVQNAFKNGVPIVPQGQPGAGGTDWAKAMDMLARAGDPDAVLQLGPTVQSQYDREEARRVARGALDGIETGPSASRLLPASAAGSEMGASVPPASAGTARRSTPGVSVTDPQAAPNITSGGSLTGVPRQGANSGPWGNLTGVSAGDSSVYGLAEQVIPDATKRAKASDFVERALGVQPGQKLNADQSARAQRILENIARSWGRQTTGLNADARGMRNDNPGNLEANGWTAGLPGYVGSDGRFARFDNLQDGQAALDRNLQGYGQRGINTPLAIASKWAPGSEAGNNPNSYGAAIAQALGVGPNDPVDLSDPNTRAKIGQAIAFVENGPGKAQLSPAARAIADATSGRPQAASAGGGAPLTLQYQLPASVTPQRKIVDLDRSMANLIGNRYANEADAPLEDVRGRIEKSAAPIEMMPGRSFVNPVDGRPILTAPYPGGIMSPQAIDAAAMFELRTGKPPANMGRGAQGSQNLVAVQNRMAEIMQENGWTPGDVANMQQKYKVQQSVLKDFSADGRSGRAIGSYNTLVGHIGLLKDAVTALQNGDVRGLNWFRQEWNEQTGNPAPTNFDGIRNMVGDELVKAITGGAGALRDREEVKRTLNSASSPKVLNSLLDNYRKLSVKQLRTLKKKYEFGTGRKDFDEMLLPETRAYFEDGGSTSSRSGSSASGNLPAGTYRYDPSTGTLEPVK